MGGLRWLLLCSGGILLAVSLGIRQSFGLFLPDFLQVYAAGAGTFSLAIALQNLTWGLLAPLFGLWADRRGAVQVVVVGVICYTAGLLLMGLGLSLPGGLLAGQFMIGLGMSGCGFSVVFGAVARAVPQRRLSMALGLVSAGGSLGQFVVPALVGPLLQALSWEGVLYVLAGMTALLVLPAMGLREHPEALASPRPWSLRDFPGRDYGLLSAGFFVCGLQVVFIITHMPAYLVEQGLPRVYAAWTLAFIGLFNIPGTLACGWLGDRLRKKNILSTIYVLRSVVILGFLALPVQGSTALLFGALMGLLWLGTVPLTSGLVAQLCGADRLATFYGITFLSHQLGSFCGAWLGGVVRDWSGDYQLMWLLVGLMGLLAAALHYPIREAVPAR